jgi:hypothetical protein
MTAGLQFPIAAQIAFCFQRGVGENDDDAYGDESDDSESISDGEDEEDENEGGDFDVAW